MEKWHFTLVFYREVSREIMVGSPEFSCEESISSLEKGNRSPFYLLQLQNRKRVLFKNSRL
jgi:hypothetical protein